MASWDTKPAWELLKFQEVSISKRNHWKHTRGQVSGEAPQLLGMPAAPARRLLGRVGENAVSRRNNGQALRYGVDRLYEVAYSTPDGDGTRAPLRPGARTVELHTTPSLRSVCGEALRMAPSQL